MVSIPGVKRDGEAPASATGKPAFVLKVDVDTHEGLRDGAPRLLELFARHEVSASWFVSMGPDRTGRAILRVFRQRGFLRKMLRSGAPHLYPWRTMLRGTLLPSIPIVTSQPDRVRAIAAAGHEVGIHGFDHVRWHDDLAWLPAAAVEGEVSAALGCFENVLGYRPAGFAAPGWQCTADSLRAIDRAGFRYRSDTRGAAPYRPQIGTYLSSIPEIPTTLPTLDELLGQGVASEADLVRGHVDRIQRDRLNVHTVHTEIEGGRFVGQLDALLTRVRDLLPVRTLADVVSELPSIDQLPVRLVLPGSLPGRGGTVARQGG